LPSLLLRVEMLHKYRTDNSELRYTLTSNLNTKPTNVFSVALQFLSSQLFIYHRYQRSAAAQPCVNGDRLSKGRMAKFDPTQIRNPSTDRHKIWNRWLRRRDDPPCKISRKSVHWGLLGKWV